MESRYLFKIRGNIKNDGINSTRAYAYSKRRRPVSYSDCLTLPFRLLLDALKESHAKDSPLWGYWGSWNLDSQRYHQALGDLHQKVSLEAQNLEKECTASGLETNENFVQVIFERSISIARHAAIYDPSMLNVRTDVDQGNGNKKDELWLGQSAVLASAKNMTELKDELSKLMQDMTEWEEVQALQELFEKMSEMKDKIEEEIEILSLRRAFPGRCRLCPV